MKNLILILVLFLFSLQTFSQQQLRANRISADTIKHSSIKEIPSWPATGLKTYYERDTLRGIDSLGIIYNLSKWDKVFRKEITSDGENNIPITFVLNQNCKVFYNGSILPGTSWTGIGLRRITLVLDTRQFDFLTINNGTQ